MANWEELIKIIRETWYYDRFCSPKTAYKLARAFLYSCLANQTYTEVAVQNGIPIGIIMGKNIRAYRSPLRYQIRLLQSVLSILLSAEGRKASGIFREVNKIDAQLLKERKGLYQGELACLQRQEETELENGFFKICWHMCVHRISIGFICLRIQAVTMDFMSIKGWFDVEKEKRNLNLDHKAECGILHLRI